MMALFTQDSRSVYVPCTEVHGAEAGLLQECNLKLVCVYGYMNCKCAFWSAFYSKLYFMI